MTRPRRMPIDPGCAPRSPSLAATGLTGCSGAGQQVQRAAAATLTIQGDAGNPTLVENFNPFQTPPSSSGTR